MSTKNVHRPPKNWREDAFQAINSFDHSIQAQAARILKRRETAAALQYMIEAASGKFNPGDFYHALRICSDCATPRRPPFSSRRRAAEIISAVDTITGAREIAIFLEGSIEGRAARRQLEKAKKFAEDFTEIPKGARRRFEQQDCFLRLYKLFQSLYGRPVMKAVRSWMKAAFPGTFHGEGSRPTGATPRTQP